MDPLPHSKRPVEYLAWIESLGLAETGVWTKREEALAFAAFIAGWYRRTGENPDADHPFLAASR